MRTETVSKAENFVSFPVSASYCSITSFSHAVTHPFRTVSCSALFFSAQSVSGSTAPAAGPYSCRCMAELQNKKTDTSLHPFLVCVSFFHFTLVLSFPLCQFLHLSCAFQYFPRYIRAAQHTCQFPYGSLIIQSSDAGFHGISIRFFLYQIMEV